MEYKIGDMVRITHTDYNDEGVDVGDIKVVMNAGDGFVDLMGSELEWTFYNWEVEPYTTPPDQYTRILEAIAGPEAVAMARSIAEALNNAS